MKKTINIIISLLLIFALVACAKTYKVTLDFNNGAEKEVIKVKKGALLKKPDNPKREGFSFVYWELDNKEFDFDNTVIKKNITLTALWEEGVYDYIKDVDYTPLLENTVNASITALLDEYIYEEEGGSASLKILDISIKATFKGVFKDYESSKFKLEIVFETGQIQTGMSGFFIPLLNKLKFKQNLYLKDGNVYSSFEGTFVDATNEEKPLKEFRPFFETAIEPMLPKDLKDQIDEILPLFKDHKEYVEDVFQEESYNDLLDTIINGGDFIESILSRETVEESAHFIKVTENGLSIKEGKDDDEVHKLEIDLNIKDNKFNSLEGMVQLKKPNDLYLEFSVTLSDEEFDLPNFDEYILVESLKIEKILKLLEENPLLESIFDIKSPIN